MAILKRKTKLVVVETTKQWIREHDYVDRISLYRGVIACGDCIKILKPEEPDQYLVMGFYKQKVHLLKAMMSPEEGVQNLTTNKPVI